MVSDKYRMQRLRSGDEWVLNTLARGNARFGDGDTVDQEWLPPLGSDDAARFVADPRTIFIVAIDLATNHVAGFIYGCVLYRRHTKLEHLCVYEVGVDVDHRQHGVARLLLDAIAAEARRMGIDRGFVITPETDRTLVRMYEEFGATRSPGTDILFGLKF